MKAVAPGCRLAPARGVATGFRDVGGTRERESAPAGERGRATGDMVTHGCRDGRRRRRAARGTRQPECATTGKKEGTSHERQHRLREGKSEGQTRGAPEGTVDVSRRRKGVSADAVRIFQHRVRRGNRGENG